jgi:redox-sensitive bicupin YhaK (pirin superfamily)
MMTIRRAEARGRTKIGWLDSRHSFSFGDYYDPEHMGFRALRVINDDRVRGGAGFGMHPHRDMEIVTYLLEGSLEHQDSLGTGSVIRPGEVQRMTAGTGILHSEYNPSRTEAAHLLQVWLLPEREGLQPGYEQRAFPEVERTGRLCLVAAHDGRDGAVTIHTDVDLYAGLFAGGETVTHSLRAGRSAWVQIARGAVRLNGEELRAGDGAAVRDEQTLELVATEAADLLLFDLA